MNKELTLEEAENIVDNMYQNRWKEGALQRRCRKRVIA